MGYSETRKRAVLCPGGGRYAGMKPPTFKRPAGRRAQTIAIVMGSHTTQAVLVQRQGEKYCLLNYVLCETPQLGKESPPELLSEHLKNVFKALDAPTNEVILVLGMEDVLLRTVDLPFYEPSRSRQLVKLNAKKYVQQDLLEFETDCFLPKLPSARAVDRRVEPQSTDNQEGSAGGPPAPEAKGQTKFRALVGAARKTAVSRLQIAAKGAGLTISRITFTQTSLTNVVSLVWPGVIQNEVVALVDLGFKTSTISIVCDGQISLTRVVEVGSEKITKSLAENLGVNYAAAEGVKLLMPEKVEPKLRKLIAALGQELRAAIDFFEHQEVKTITKVFISGGAARSNLVIESLHDELGTRCERLNPFAVMDVALPPLKTGDLEKESPQLAAAVGAAITWSLPDSLRINLLAEEQEAVELRRRDPVKRGLRATALIALAMFSWVAVLWLRGYVLDLQLQGTLNEAQWLKKSAEQVAQLSRQAGLNERTFEALQEQAAKRSLWAPPLNALQRVAVDNIQLVRFNMHQTIIRPPPSPPRARGDRSPVAPPEPAVEKLVIVLEAKNYGEPAVVDQFIESIGKQPYFRENLREVNPIVLVNRLPPQVDPMDTDRTFTLFTVECIYRDRILGYE